MKKLSEMKISERIRAVKHDVELCMGESRTEFDTKLSGVKESQGFISFSIAGAYMYKSMGLKTLEGTFSVVQIKDEQERCILEGIEKLVWGNMSWFLLAQGLTEEQEYRQTSKKLESIHLKWDRLFESPNKPYQKYSFGEVISLELLLMIEECANYLESEGL